MKFEEFSDTAEKINNTSKNTKKREMVSKLIVSAGDDREIVSRFIQGRIFPIYVQKNLNVSTSIMRSAISESSGESIEDIEEMLVGIEDLGSLFEDLDIKTSKGQQTLGQNKLTVTEVQDRLHKIAEESGEGSQQRKIDHIVSMLSRCNSVEAKYLSRLILENMSIGVGSGTVRKAISDSYNIDEDVVERAIMITNDVGHVAEVAFQEGEKGLKNQDLDVCEVPLRPMKATKGKVTECFDDMDCEEVIGDFKYDGFRIQIHKNGDDVQLFTRRLENVTSSLPDVVEIVKEKVDADSIVLDGEIMGYKSDDFKNPLPYQKTQQRIRRKYDIDEMIKEIPVTPKIFDVLYYQGELVIDDPLEERIQISSNVCDSSILAEQRRCKSVKDLQKLMSDASRKDHEGGMAKNPQSTYEPNSRKKRWLKLKPEGETIDAVVIGGEYGNGRRSEFIASYELGLLNNNTGELESIGDVGTGFTDEQFEEMTEMLEEEIISQNGQSININPTYVFEVEFEEVQPSPKYESGYGLRFPRFIRLRKTKDVEDADTIDRLESIAEDK